ncbi:hypothetical protein WN48_02760 [Eufriesea mexicana]|uniref:Uncharacterized protein n=1 Tax=Eufriesea mexicana TaxID=516756 RepID=A0A310SEV6_9HYME|nr:hypothetical protein WN48_02760 [Eufriesea mexicana]
MSSISPRNEAASLIGSNSDFEQTNITRRKSSNKEPTKSERIEEDAHPFSDNSETLYEEYELEEEDEEEGEEDAVEERRSTPRRRIKPIDAPRRVLSLKAATTTVMAQSRDTSRKRQKSQKGRKTLPKEMTDESAVVGEIPDVDKLDGVDDIR